MNNAIVVTIIVLALGYVIYDRIFNKKGEKILVEYSEVVGREIIQHPKLYQGISLKNQDKLKIKSLGIERPNPPHEVLRQTNQKLKIVGIIKIDHERYAYRVPNMDNAVFTYKRDQEGHVIKNEKGRPVIIKKSWTYCDDISEPDTKHWERLRKKEIEEKHKARDRLLQYMGALSVAVVFVFAIIALSITNKTFMADKTAIMERADQNMERADKLIDNLNRVMGDRGNVKIIQGDDTNTEEEKDEGEG